jgi:hypothetical protein
MKFNKILGALATVALVGACVEETPPSSEVNNWDNVRSSWGDRSEFAGDSSEAQDAFEFMASSGGSTGARWGWWFEYEICCSASCAGYTSTLYAGQTINAGTVNVSNDATNLYIAITGANGWLLNAAHAYAGSGPVPTNSAGNPAPGLFPYAQSFAPPAANYTFTIPLASIPASCNDTLNVAVHTESVQVDEDGQVTEAETGWADGPFEFGDPEDPDNGCPEWIEDLDLGVSIAYSGNTGYLSNGWPIFHLGDTVYGDITICNPESVLVDGLTVTAMEEVYGTGVLLGCSSPVTVWSNVQIAANDCLTLSYSFYLATTCPYGNYQTHIMITRDGDEDCPTAAVFFDESQVGIYDPPAEG